MKSLIIAIIVCVAINAVAQITDQERQLFFSLGETEKIAFWWEHSDIASLNEYARVLSGQGAKQKALATAIRLDLLAAISNLSAASFREMETEFAQICAAMNGGPERDALTSWLRDTGLNIDPSSHADESWARQFGEERDADIKSHQERASVRLSRAFSQLTQTNTANVIAHAWHDPNPTALLGVAEQRLAADTNDLAGLCVKLDYLVFQSFSADDSAEIERLLSCLKLQCQTSAAHDDKTRLVQKWLNFSLPAYEEALTVLKSGDTEEIARIRESFRSAKQNGALPSAELFRRLDSIEPSTSSVE